MMWLRRSNLLLTTITSTSRTRPLPRTLFNGPASILTFARPIHTTNILNSNKKEMRQKIVEKRTSFKPADDDADGALDEEEGEEGEEEEYIPEPRKKKKVVQKKVDEREKVVIVHPTASGKTRAAETVWRVDEAVNLCSTLNWDVAKRLVVPIRSTHRSTYFRKGKIDELKDIVEKAGGDVLYINTSLTPMQEASLNETYDFQVKDRFDLVLDIFAQRAVTREAKLQIELASLAYKKSSLIRLYDSDTSDTTEQQRGGEGTYGTYVTYLSGTQSMSGYGETKLEKQRRIIHERERKIKLELSDIQKKRATHRSNRIGLPVVAVVGYTNAGKSALINRLTGSELDSKDQNDRFSVVLPSGRKVLLSDTVGFISDLPKILYTAFRSTLEEVVSADLILHVRDIHHVESDYQRYNVESILGTMDLPPGCYDNHIQVWNKIDLLKEEELAEKIEKHPENGPKIVTLSAREGRGCDTLVEMIEKFFRDRDEGKLKPPHIPKKPGDDMSDILNPMMSVSFADLTGGTPSHVTADSLKIVNGFLILRLHRQIIFCSAHKAATTKLYSHNNNDGTSYRRSRLRYKSRRLNTVLDKNTFNTSVQEHMGLRPLWPHTGIPLEAALLTAPTD
ncbi:GTP-binding protein HflX [Planoprotostelium fungivorum]|uniref:GTP-binding protein HflX n=1 Tax=Planoprotostelium fungivorum TaxID=1890364 RepID=A0A2P6NIQ9_9EUKA|nr:GTP-binding protein HflX [Planoprotostelium fungivorum]